jgi:hypothetical protein
MPRSNGRTQRRTRGVRLKQKKLVVHTAKSGVVQSGRWS